MECVHTVVLVRGDRRQVARIWIVDTAPYRLRLEGMGRLREAAGDTLLSALAGLRTQLAADGWSIAVAGARRDARPVSGDGTKVRIDGGGQRGNVVGVLCPVADVALLDTAAERSDRRP